MKNVDCGQDVAAKDGFSGHCGYSRCFDDGGFVNEFARNLSGDTAPEVTAGHRTGPDGRLLLD